MDRGLIAKPGPCLGPETWTAVFELLGTVWPRLPAAVETADRLGFRWRDVSHPFAWFEGGRALAHVGVLAVPVRVAGEDRTVAGVHAVCSHPEARGRGLVRRCLEAALEYIDKHFDCAKLHTGDPALYAKFGFRMVPTFRFRSTRPGGGGRGRLLRPSESKTDAVVLIEGLQTRKPIAEGFASRDPGWLAVIDAALSESLDTTFFEVPGGLLAAALEPDGCLRVDELLSAEPFDVESALDAIPNRFSEVIYTFDPSTLGASAHPDPTPKAEGVLMVRGHFPLEAAAVSPLWQH